MNWTTFLACMLLAVSVMWFTERPQTTVQRVTLWLSYGVTSAVFAALMPREQIAKNIMIYALPILAYAIYRAVVNIEIKRAGRRYLVDEQKTRLQWRKDAIVLDGHSNGVSARRKTSHENARAAANQPR